MLIKCPGGAGKRNPGMGLAQVGSTQGQGEEAQRNLRRQHGVEKGLGVFICLWSQGFFPTFPAVCFVVFFTYTESEFEVDLEYQ